MFGYHLQMKDRNSILWQRVSKTVIRATHLKVTNISAGLIYEFKVAAENAAGLGAFSKVSDAVLAIDACGKFTFKTSQGTTVIILQLPQNKSFTFLSLQSRPSICASMTSQRTLLAWSGRNPTIVVDPRSLATSSRRERVLVPSGPRLISPTLPTPASP